MVASAAVLEHSKCPLLRSERVADERRRRRSQPYGKAVAGKALAAQEAGKRSTFLSKNEQLEFGAKPAGVSPFSNWDIRSVPVS